MTGRVLVTGGAGFIGAALVRRLLADGAAERVVNVDCLTYAADRRRLASVDRNRAYAFEDADIADANALKVLFAEHQPTAVLHLAAESHVDRSIDQAAPFLQANVVGTSVLLQAALDHWRKLAEPAQRAFRFIHVSTDEVYGDLDADAAPFTESSPYNPHSPYAASKAASDHMARAWHHTYGLPVIVTNCSNNYGPYQFPEKLIPLMIVKAKAREKLPVYGDGSNVRDWLHVDDHVAALVRVLESGKVGATYMIGGGHECSNLELVRQLCALIDERRGAGHERLIEFVSDRPGHDRRYAVDSRTIRRTLGWKPARDFATGLAATVDWYLANEAWWRPLLDQRYAGGRLGLGGKP
ncbi:MAG: dTDP-glucose 4,6-dehydratase [Alphaproteobacteria bacterium]